MPWFCFFSQDVFAHVFFSTGAKWSVASRAVVGRTCTERRWAAAAA